MEKIATHNSATGESGIWYSWLLAPFAKCQSKTIKQQYESGCRLFDIRLKLVNNKWRMAHGWWYTKRSAEDIIKEMNKFKNGPCRITLTYEGKGKNNELFLMFIIKLKSLYKNIKYGPVAVKYGKGSKGYKVSYDYILPGDNNWLNAPSVSKFMKLDGHSWHTFIPIPWIWKKICYNNPKFNEEKYTYVDFL